MKLKEANKPFLSLFKIMPTEGEIEKYVKLQKKAGFPMLSQNHAAAGKRIDLEDIKKAEKNPGRLVTAEELNKMANFKPEQSPESSCFGDETDRTYLEDEKYIDPAIKPADVSPDPTKKQKNNVDLEEEKQVEHAVVEESKEHFRKQKSSAEKLKEKEKKSFQTRKFERFVEPPRWVMAERCFDTQRRLRCKKLWWEDYSSSSDNDDFWGRDVDNVLSSDN